jgi:hypothetical protein
MDALKSAVQAIQEERKQVVGQLAKLDAALAALGANGAGPQRHRMSAAARKRISIAQKARWAKAKKT